MAGSAQKMSIGVLDRQRHLYSGPVRYRPDDAELLDAIAGLLESQVLPAVPPDLQHPVRVAANLARILERQQAREPEALERERRRLADLLGHDGTVADLRAELDRRLGELDPRKVWEVLVATARDDLAASKPGYDGWEGG
jgi:hypothetical protein